MKTNINIDQLEFSVFDTETTGLNPQAGDRIIEIAAIRFKGATVLSTFQSLINPHRPVSEGAFQVNRISPEMLEQAPEGREVLPEFLRFIEGSCLCSYNAAFDMEFLDNELKLLGLTTPPDIEIVDILKMARRLLPGISRYALISVSESLGLGTAQQHRAFFDAELAFRVFTKLKQTLKLKDIEDVQSFFSLFSINKKSIENLNNHKIARIEEAISLGGKLRIKYLSGSATQITLREVLPKEIKQDRGALYLVGLCYLRNEERTFRIDGILQLEII